MDKAKLKYLGCIAFLLPALLIMLAKPFSPELSAAGHTVLGGVLITIGIWILKPFDLPYSAGGLFLAAFTLICGLKPATVFSGFTQSAIWTLVPALFFGVVLRDTGLGKRIAMAILRLSRPSYPSLILAWVVIGVALSVFTPSVTVRVVIMVSIAAQCCELCNMEKNSKAQSLIMLTAFAMAMLPGCGWLSGALWGPIIQGFFSSMPVTADLVNFQSWLSVMLIPMVIISFLLVVTGYFALRPEKKLSPEVFASLKAENKTPLSAKEKSACVILLMVFAFFITGRLHGIPDAAICLAAVVAFFALKVLGPNDVATGVSWDLIIFIAMAMSLNSIFIETGIAAWLSGIIVPALGFIAGNTWSFALIMLALLFAWRFVDVAMFIPTIAILVPIVPSIHAAYGINPLVWIPLLVMAGNGFIMAYQNMWAMMTVKVSGDRGWQPKHLAIYGLLYFIICVAVMAVILPIWLRMSVI